MGLSRKHQDISEIGDKILELKEEKQNLLLKKAATDNSKQRIEEMLEFMDQNDFIDLEFDDILVRRLVERVLVIDEQITIKFKSGIEVIKQI